MEGQPPQEPPPGMPGGPDGPSEEELRARLEEQLRQVRVQDLLVESAASIINLSARRIAKEDEQDLEQGRIGIEAVRGMVDLIEGEVQQQIRAALSELQLLYAKHSSEGGGDGGAGGGEGPPPGEPDPPRPQSPPPGGSGLWTPGR